MPFHLAIFGEDVLSADAETKRVLYLLNRCNVTNIALYSAEKMPKELRSLGTENNLQGRWLCAKDEDEVIRTILAHYEIFPHDTLYVGHLPPSIGRAKKAGIATICLGKYLSPSYIEGTRPHYIVRSIPEVFAIVYAQLGS